MAELFVSAYATNRKETTGTAIRCEGLRVIGLGIHPHLSQHDWYVRSDHRNKVHPMPDDIVELPAELTDEEELEDEETGPSGRKGPRRPQHLDQKIAAHAKRLRDQRGWSLADVADAVTPHDPDERWTKSRVTQFEKPSRRATVTELADLCKAFGIPIFTFLQDAGVFKLPQSTRGWIEADPTLTDKGRERVLDVYLLSQKQD